MQAGTQWNRLRWFVVAGGVVMLLTAILLPVDRVVARAIPASVLKEIEASGGTERIHELQSRFALGLQFLRCALAVLGAWMVGCGALWVRLSVWARRYQSPDKRPLSQEVTLKEFYIPAALALGCVALGFPLLFKGFEHAEFTNFVMLARRGPLVAAACQNLPPRAAQPAFTIIESLFVKVLGESEFAARLPALLFGALGLFPFYSLARRFSGVAVAALAAVALATNGFFLFYLTYAKGYAMAMAAFLACTALAARLRHTDAWRDWCLLACCAVITIYAHFSSAMHVAVLCLVFLAERLWSVYRREKTFAAVGCGLVRPVVSLGTAVLILAVLYSVGIPTELHYMKLFSMTSYYMAYHVNPRFVYVMADLCAAVRGVPAIAWAGVGCAAVGFVVAFRRDRTLALMLLLPAVAVVAMFGLRGWWLYPRFLFNFLPAAVLMAILPLGRLLERLRGRGVVGVGWAVVLLAWVASATLTLSRLYAMERSGTRLAVERVREEMQPGEQVMGVLDSYDLIKHYYPDVISGKWGDEFRSVLGGTNLPRFVISVSYQDYDIAGASAMLDRHYSLERIPSWLDVVDDQDSVYLYRMR